MGFQLQLVDLLNPDNPIALDSAVLLLTFLGDWKILGLVGVGVFFRDRQLGKTLLVALALTAALVYPLKLLMQEPRPWAEHPEIRAIGYEEPSGSFPSGHAAFSFSYFMVMSKRKKYMTSLLAIAILVSFTRIYLGHHYPVDVAVGALLGIITGFSTARFLIVNEREQ